MSSTPKISIIQAVADKYLHGIQNNDIQTNNFVYNYDEELLDIGNRNRILLDTVYKNIYNYQQTRAPKTLGALVKIYNAYSVSNLNTSTVDPQGSGVTVTSTPTTERKRSRSVPDLTADSPLPFTPFAANDIVGNNADTRPPIVMTTFTTPSTPSLNSARSDDSRKLYVPTLIFLQAEAMYAFIRGTQKYESLVHETTLCGLYFALLGDKTAEDDEESNNMLTYVNALVEQLCLFYRRLFPCFASSHDTVTSQSLENLLDATHRAMRTFNNAWSYREKFSGGIRDNPHKKIKLARSHRVQEALRTSTYMYYGVYAKWKKDVDDTINTGPSTTIINYDKNYLDFVGALFSNNVVSIAEGIEYIRSMHVSDKFKSKSVLKIIAKTAGINAIFEYDKDVTLWYEKCSDTRYWGSMKLCRTFDQTFIVALMGMLAYDIRHASQNQRCSNLMRESFKSMMRMVLAVLDGIPYDVGETFKLFMETEKESTSLNTSFDTSFS